MKPQPIYIAVAMAIGLLDLFAGYRLFKLVVAASGFIAGALLVGPPVQAHAGTAVGVAVGLVAGIACGAALYYLYFVAVFVLGAALGAGLAGSALGAAGAQPNVVVVIVCSALGGLAALLLQKLFIILATAFSGAWALVCGAAYFAGVLRGFDAAALRALSQNTSLVMFVIMLVLSGFGIAAQYGFTARRYTLRR
ncbi:MAG: DUF4203 domain-containing protein [Myxococcales bacterium]|nr:DUF4203 domain-containing protein [Myxococcales bacterium]